MAKVIKRIGTLAQKFSVDITVHSVQMTLSIPVRLNIIWKRRNKRIESRNKVPLSPAVGSAEVEETLTMINTLYQKKNGTFNEKKAVLTVQAVIEGKGTKSVGQVAINIAEYATNPLRSQVLKLEKAPDRYASITISVAAQAMGEATMADNASDASGGTGISMGTEGDYTGPLTDQDLTGFEEDTKIIAGTQGRPPALIKTHKMPDIVDPVNPQRITEAMDRHAQDMLGRANKPIRIEREQSMPTESSLKEKTMLEGQIRCWTYRDLEGQLRDAEQTIDENVSKCEQLEARWKSEQAERRKAAQALAAAEENLQKAQRAVSEQLSEQSSELAQKDAHISNLTQSLDQLRKELSESRSAIGAKGDSDASFSTYKKRTEVMITDLRRQVQSLETEKEDYEAKIAQLMLVVKQAKIENNRLEYQWRAKCDELEQEISAAHESKSTHQSQDDPSSADAPQLKKRISALEQSLKDANSAKNRLAEDCKDLKRQLQQAADNPEFSDPANLILTEQVHSLESKLEQQSADYEADKADLRAKVEHLEQLLERTKKQMAKQKAQAEARPVEVARPVETTPVQAEAPSRDMERKYVEAKMTLANVEMEKEVLMQKYKEAQEKLRQYSQQYTELEVEFYKVNERFGMTINAQNDLEMEIQELRGRLGDKKRGK